MNERKFGVYEGGASTEPMRESSSSGGNGGNDIRERLAKLETHMQYIATKDDIKDIKIWVLSGVIVAFILAISSAFTILKYTS